MGFLARNSCNTSPFKFRRVRFGSAGRTHRSVYCRNRPRARVSLPHCMTTNAMNVQCLQETSSNPSFHPYSITSGSRKEGCSFSLLSRFATVDQSLRDLCSTRVLFGEGEVRICPACGWLKQIFSDGADGSIDRDKRRTNVRRLLK